jgi:hypothetical protein
VIGMAVKSTDTKSTTVAAAKDEPVAAQTAPAEAAPARVASDCVVDEPFHVGRAVNGLVCSYHAMHYASDGTRR